MRRLMLLGLLLLTGSVFAQQRPADAPDTAEPPPLPEEGSVMEPEVRIIRKGDDTIHEYRVQGKLVAVQITPKVGVPYYLVDADGDGELESRRSELDPRFLIPGWVIKRW